jgi:sugar/nucleoside kinase (ribokinase family)
MTLLVLGTLAYDSIHTPLERRDNVLGGSAVYCGLAAAPFGPLELAGVIGDDFEQRHLEELNGRGIGTRAVSRQAGGKTFRWAGRYEADWNTRTTLSTDLNVLVGYRPHLPSELRSARYVFLANAEPRVQLELLSQCPRRHFTLADTMNLWIQSARAELLQVLKQVDGLVLNDEEARLLTGERSLVRAALAVRNLGPRYVLLKKGEHGAFLIGESVRFALPAYPVSEVVDPTGAGDSFAGGFMGYLAHSDSTEPRTLRRAMLYGTVTASYCVEHFSVDGLRHATRSKIESRYNELVELTGG